jgi:hypothetical protein
MSANGTFSTTLDYEFFGGGFSTIEGGASGSINPTLISTSKVYIVGGSSNNFISFDFDSSAQMPGIFASLEQTIDFTFSSTVEFGVQRWATANTRIEFTFDTMVGYNLTHAYLDKTISFTAAITADQFSLGDTDVSYSFLLDGKAINISTHTYDKVGKNGVDFRDNYNGVMILNNTNSINLVKDGVTSVDILSPV